MRYDLDTDPDYIDLASRVWVQERLPVHEARTEADLWSSAQPAQVVFKNLYLVRSTRKVMAA
jgi:hypothetical protein